MMSDSGHNSQQGAFSVGKEKLSTVGRDRVSRRRSKSELVDRINEFVRHRHEGDLAWSPAPMDMDTVRINGGPTSTSMPTSTFSVGKTIGGTTARRSQREQVVTVPNVPIVPIVGRQGRESRESGPSASVPATTRIIETINEYRRKGNHAFKMKCYETACLRYSNAIVTSLALPLADRTNPGLSKSSLPLLYCNRAAAYLALGKPVEALEDCKAGMREGPMYHKCRFRAATCLTRMGRFTEARRVISSLSSTDANILAERARREEEVDAAEAAFEVYAAALRDGIFTTMEAFKMAYKGVETHVPHSEALSASLVVGHLKLGEFSAADRILDGIFSGASGSSSSPKGWAGWCRVQTCFFKADALQTCRNLEALGGLLNGSNDVDAIHVSSVLSVPNASSIASMRQGIKSLQQLKDRAHAQMQHRAFDQAIETYTSALAGPHLSPALAAILLSNRAAAYQSTGQRALALADCCRAVAVSPMFAKPHSRMAAVLVDLGLFLDAQRAIEQAVACAVDASQRVSYLSMARGIAHHRQQQADHWLLLGVPHGASGAEAKKAYRKLALKLHPDKTSQAVKIDYQLGEDGVRVGTADETQRLMLEKATWVFKLLGEAQDALN